MRTTFAADLLALFFLMTLVPQCLARPASALFGHGHKSLPLSERRDSAIAERHESIIDRRESVITRRDSVVSQDGGDVEIGKFQSMVSRTKSATNALQKSAPPARVFPS